MICAFIIFFEPTVGGWFLEHDNFIPANNLVTPTAIKPVWYFTPFYAILRMIPSKGLGVIALAGSIIVLFLVPWLDRGKVKSIRYRGLGYKIALAVFAIVFVLLGSIGADKTAEWIPQIFGPDANVTSIENTFGRILTVLYFGFFLFLWAYTYFGWEKTKPVPDRVTTHG